MALFAVQLRFTDTDRRMQVRPAHRDYLTSLKEAGKLVTAGPFADQTGALLIYDVADEAELRDILAKDPYTPADVYEIAALDEWQPLFPLA
ncbi:MAG TPA: muconolactone Delta-isomerase family protein [Kribbella sp.]|uniref:YciI family protein n=1 Tax=Kribbella sp. TaxID=1871183 RepID=UPI002D783DCB|nr:muconolactone Delta-isomerase family protein [Kribbella sp.]HET6298589.1 muconolactone Delta-isomerase family protein [Kribbella sp.]